MASWDDDFDLPEKWGPEQRSIWQDMVRDIPPAAREDNTLMMLYDYALFDDTLSPRDKDVVYFALTDLLRDDYGVDFDEIFDWEAYKEWYENA